MSVPQPSSVTLTIAALINKVAAYLQNRADVTESQTNPEMRPSAWIRDSLREITANNPFTELQVIGPLKTIGPNLGYQGSNFAYPVSFFLWQGHDLTISEDPVIFLTSSQGSSAGLSQVSNPFYTLTNMVAYSMDYLPYKSASTIISVGGGVPFKYTRYGSNYYFGVQPGSNYQVYLPYQRRHPFSSELTESLIYVPEDWFDIIAIAAAERGATVLRWNEQAQYLHQLLYGDPMYQQSGGEQGRPGLIAARVLQPERDQRLSPVAITPVIGRY